MPEAAEALDDLEKDLLAAWDDADLDSDEDTDADDDIELPDLGPEPQKAAEPETPDETETDFNQEPTGQETQPSEPDIEPDSQPVEAPGSWTKEDRALFDSVPKRVKDIPQWSKRLQEVIARRQAEADSGFNRKLNAERRAIREQQQRYAEFDQVLKPYEREFALKQISPAGLFRHYLAADQLSKENPVKFVREMLQTRNIPVQDFVNALTAAPQSQVDPHFAAMARKVEALEQRDIAQQQEAQRARQESTFAELDAVRTEKDERGNPKRPFLAFTEDGPKYPQFYEMVCEQAAIVRQKQPSLSPRQIVEVAYDRAVKLDPQASKFVETQRAEAQRRKAQAARAAGSSISGAPSGSTPHVDQQPDDLEAALLYNAKRLGLA